MNAAATISKSQRVASTICSSRMNQAYLAITATRRYAAQTIFDYRSNSRACAEYEALAEEIEVRLKNFEKLFGAAPTQVGASKLAANE
jgi:hypothetical protein